MSKTITDTELSEWQKFPTIVRNHRCFDLFREKLNGMIFKLFSNYVILLIIFVILNKTNILKLRI